MSHARQNEKVLFEAARNLNNPGARQAFPEQTCGNNPTLRDRLDGLLAVEMSAEEFFKGDPLFGASVVDGIIGLDNPPMPALDSIDPLNETKGGDERNVRNVRYKLLQRMGEGGCGVVYMAEQEEPVRRRVALKVIRLGMDTENVIARFEAERQTLALMDHPNIVIAL